MTRPSLLIKSNRSSTWLMTCLSRPRIISSSVRSPAIRSPNCRSRAVTLETTSSRGSGLSFLTGWLSSSPNLSMLLEITSKGFNRRLAALIAIMAPPIMASKPINRLVFIGDPRSWRIVVADTPICSRPATGPSAGRSSEYS